ncbi:MULTISPECIES: 2-dehydro-3-deoxy-6-phosphogalactonate aldolase [unclassified Pseudoxanthomonas]|uniref:2-dehydro-3-deoxy-6-phosphogalactonate aldolase n=1 Tax=unclassified Pseudoxanthomonas TaxID=2645906 RepID=UPI0008E3A9D9|nr:MULTISPECIES: 2-dehydro-3-deoxy-6-phosphogalactonate aldolase [unclassified Pseudoxanthomonas]PPJ43032.1 2-dehydro-3-deoxy-6-phosphogalactonate aldolase [Pseudoxanthomonas sp. KAs_5_3]SFV33980.1 2-keto-3-deoxy-phosphogalactonate aldolase [Pseudoxanthomonas sp. YR558]
MDAPALPFALPLIAILRGITPADVPAHVGALVEEGYDAIEIPTNSLDWARSVRIAAEAFGDRAWIGAGTVLTTADADALRAAGGRWMVTPNTRPPVIRHAVERGLQVAAGVATASEAFDALDAGAQMLKLFPASVYGPAMVRALRSVLPPVPLFAVGGVTPDTLSGYLSAGCQGAGIGGELYKPGQPVERTREHARRFRQAYLDHAA